MYYVLLHCNAVPNSSTHFWSDESAVAPPKVSRQFPVICAGHQSVGDVEHVGENERARPSQ
jgi:hypothetical protein